MEIIELRARQLADMSRRKVLQQEELTFKAELEVVQLQIQREANLTVQQMDSTLKLQLKTAQQEKDRLQIKVDQLWMEVGRLQIKVAEAEAMAAKEIAVTKRLSMEIRLAEERVHELQKV